MRFDQILFTIGAILYIIAMLLMIKNQLRKGRE